MYTLRLINKTDKCVTKNIYLGNSYKVELYGSPDYLVTRTLLFVQIWGKDETAEQNYFNPFVVDSEGGTYFIENNHEAYIMTENGKTFENLTSHVQTGESKW